MPAIHLSYFAFCECFRDTCHEIRNTRCTLFAFHSNFMFRLRNPLTYRANANPDAKCKIQKTRCEMQKKWHEIPCYTLFVFGISWTFLQGLTIKFQDCASKTGKKVSKKDNKFFLFKIHLVRVDTMLGACFQASKCLFEVRLWNSLQSSGYIPLNGRNILESLSFDE